MYNFLTKAEEYVADNTVSNYIYTTRLWNYLRRNWHGTDLCNFDIERGDLVIGVDRTCVKDDGDIVANKVCNYQFCKHTVEYRYNGEIQKEILPRNIILRMCRQTGFYLDEHFSVAQQVKKRLLDVKSKSVVGVKVI